MKEHPRILRNALLGATLVIVVFLAVTVISSSGSARDQTLVVEFSRSPAYDLTIDSGDPAQIVDGYRVDGVMWQSRRAVGWYSDGRPITISLRHENEREASGVCLSLGQRPAAEAFLPHSIDVFGSNSVGGSRQWLGSYYPPENTPSDPKSYTPTEACIGFDPRRFRTFEIVVAPRGPYFFTDEITVTRGRLVQPAAQSGASGAIAVPAAFAMQRLWIANALKGAVRSYPGVSGTAVRELMQSFERGETGRDPVELQEVAHKFGKWRASTLADRANFRLVKADPFAAASTLDLPRDLPGAELHLSGGNIAIAAASAIPVGAKGTKFAFSFSVEGAAKDAFRSELSYLDTVLTAGGISAADVLRPLPSTLSVPAGLQQMIWITIHASMDAADGRYLARLKVTDLDAGTSKIVTWPLRLYHLKSVASPFASVVWGYPDQAPVKFRPARAAEDMLDHGANVAVVPASLMPWPVVENGRLTKPDFRKFDQAFDTFAKSRQVLLFLGFKGKSMAVSQRFGLPDDSRGPEWDRRFSAWIGYLAAHMKARGITSDRVAFYPVDEPGSPQERLLFSRLASLIRTSAPGWQIYTTLRITDDVDPMAFREADIVQLDDATFDPRFANALIAAKKEVWLYTAESTGKGADPAAVYRGLAWRAVAAGLKGAGAWSYSLNGDNGSPWDDFDGTEQDRAMVYPSDSGWLSSRRWEAWRLGMQDAELLLVALENATTAAQRNRIRNLAAKGSMAQHDPATLDAITRELMALAGAN